MIFNNLYDKNENDNNGKNGNTESVVKLIETRNDLNENDNNGKTALMLAAKNGNTENINIIKKEQERTKPDIDLIDRILNAFRKNDQSETATPKF